MLYCTHMKKQKDIPFIRSLLKESFQLTWAHKAWWFIGFIAVFLTTSIGYQLIFQGIQSIAEPRQWWERWQIWAQGTSPIEFFQAQFSLLTNDPIGWGVAFLVWLIVLVVVAIFYALSVYAITTLISVVKMKRLNGEESLLLAVREAWNHFWGVFWSIILTQLVANAIILLFSIPVIWFGVKQSGVLANGFLLGFFLLFLFSTFVLSILALYTIMYVVVEEEKLSSAIILAWKLFKTHWVISLEMFFIQLMIGLLVFSLAAMLIALVVIPVAVLGYFLVSNQIYDFTVFLPQLALFLITLFFVIVGAAFNVFYLYSWTSLFMRFKEVHPKSRLATWIEIKLLTS